MARNEIKAIPTTYKGIKMRSRLEAHWAAVFDLCGWDWEYEPNIEFPKADRGPWIPDFLIRPRESRFHQPGFSFDPNLCLVEVKPANSIYDLQSHEEVLRAAENTARVGYDFLAVGPFPDRGKMMPEIGMFSAFSPFMDGFDPVDHLWDPVMWFWSPEDGYGIHGIGSDLYIASDGFQIQEVRFAGLSISSWLSRNEGPECIWKLWDKIWNEAKNASQWRPK